jgi:diguanylate cyclase (GGDEF)-like protein
LPLRPAQCYGCLEAIDVSPRSDDALPHELEVINEITKAVTSTLDVAEVIRTTLARIKTLASAEAISLLRYDPERDELVFAATETLRESTLGSATIERQRGLAAWVARTGRSARVEDAATDARCGGTHGALSACDGKQLLAVPVLRDGHVVAVIELADRYEGTPFSADDQHALEETAAGFADVIYADRLARDPDLVRKVLAEAVRAVPAQAAAVLLFGANGNDLVFSASRRLETGVVDGIRIPADQGIAGWVARHRQAVLLEDASRDPRWSNAFEATTRFRPHGMLCVPVISRSTLHGVIQVMNRLDGLPFDARQLRLVQILADHAAIALENAALYRQAQLAAVTDDLTGMGNSRRLNQLLPQLIADGRPLALLVLDLDNFKAIVDGYGHLVGSQTLAYLGKLMARQLRPGDVAARFGGDEFAVILPDSAIGAGVAMAEALRATVAAATRIDGTDVDITDVTASVGVAAFPEHAQEANALLRAADQAMYAVKLTRKNGVGVAE